VRRDTACPAVSLCIVWRGLVASDEVVAQPSIDVAKSGFNVNVWGNMDLEDRQDGTDNKTSSMRSTIQSAIRLISNA